MRGRPAFTLIELVVVMALIATLVALGAVMMPSTRARALTTGADRLQGWLLIAKQRARRDGLPTGLRLSADADNKVRKLQYIQQPDDFSVPFTSCQCDGSRVVQFAPGLTPQGQPVAVDLATANVNAGDCIEFSGGGGVYPIQSSDVPNNRLILAVNGPNTTGNPVADYRVLRRPFPLVGEIDLDLPAEVLLDPAQSLNVPVARDGNCEILFSPHGGLIGSGTKSNDIVVLWLQDAGGQDPKLCVVITPHTGFVAVQPAGPSANPFQFCRDARASGL